MREYSVTELPRPATTLSLSCLLGSPGGEKLHAHTCATVAWSSHGSDHLTHERAGGRDHILVGSRNSACTTVSIQAPWPPESLRRWKTPRAHACAAAAARPWRKRRSCGRLMPAARLAPHHCDARHGSAAHHGVPSCPSAPARPRRPRALRRAPDSIVHLITPYNPAYNKREYNILVRCACTAPRTSSSISSGAASSRYDRSSYLRQGGRSDASVEPS